MTKNVLFLLVDSLRSDKVFQNKNSQIPNIENLIKTGTSFSQTISSSDSTLISIASMFTGMHPFKTGIRSERFNKLQNNVITLFQILSNCGYNQYSYQPTVTQTIGLFPNFKNLDNSYNYHNDLDDGLGKQIIDKFTSGYLKEPWFFYIHFNDLHFPITVQKEFDDEKYGTSNYEKQLSSIDVWIGKILEQIDLENTLVILTSDHGVFIPYLEINGKKINFEINGREQINKTKLGNKIPSFLNPIKTKVFFSLEKKKKQKKLHLLNSLNLKPHEKRSLLWQRTDLDRVLFDDNVHVPLIFAGHKIPKNKSIPQLVRTIDMLPTILDILKIDLIEKIDGQSIFPLMNNEKIDEIPAYMETTPLIEKKANEVIGIRTSQYKYFRDREDISKRIHLYDLIKDSFEDKNLGSNRFDLIEKLESTLQQILNENNLHDHDQISEEESKEIEKELKKLGYD